MDFLKRITFGRYVDTGSPVHKLDPRTKLITLIIIALLIFYGVGTGKNGINVLAALIGVSFLIIALSRIRIIYVTKCILKFFWFFLFIIIFHLFFTPGRVVSALSSYGIIVTYEGLTNAALTVTKLYIVIQYTYIFILTTTPLEITNAICRIFSFLKIFKVPVEDIAMMITLAIKFIPTFFKEIRKIAAAQRARGIVFNEGSIKKRIKAASLIFTPIFYNTFKRADELNTAMISRGYRTGAKRTSYKNIRFRITDYLVLASVTIFLVVYLV